VKYKEFGQTAGVGMTASAAVTDGCFQPIRGLGIENICFSVDSAQVESLEPHTPTHRELHRRWHRAAAVTASPYQKLLDEQAGRDRLKSHPVAHSRPLAYSCEAMRIKHTFQFTFQHNCYTSSHHQSLQSCLSIFESGPCDHTSRSFLDKKTFAHLRFE
jgi:hypothetical protein